MGKFSSLFFLCLTILGQTPRETLSPKLLDQMSRGTTTGDIKREIQNQAGTQQKQFTVLKFRIEEMQKQLDKIDEGRSRGAEIADMKLQAEIDALIESYKMHDIVVVGRISKTITMIVLGPGILWVIERLYNYRKLQGIRESANGNLSLLTKRLQETEDKYMELLREKGKVN